VTASGLTLSTFRTRLQNVLVDVGATTWAADTLDEATRQALSDLGGVMGIGVVLSGLDGAASTTVDALDDDLLIRGAAAYAVQSRLLARAEMTNLATRAPDTLTKWMAVQMVNFKLGLEAVRRRVLARSSSAPAGVLPWDESTRNW